VRTPLVLIVAVVSSSLLAAPARADTIKVPQDFTTIQEALDNAAQDDVVLIKSGLYAESVTANALPLNVIIKAAGNVRIDATGLGAGLTVSGQNLQVIGIKVIGGTDGIVVGGQNPVLSKCQVSDVTGRGIVIGGLNPSAFKCKVTASGQEGLAIVSASNPDLEKCVVTDSTGPGLSIDEETDNAFIFKCRFVRPGGDGIFIEGPNSFIEGCRVLEAVGRGIVDNTTPLAVGPDLDFNKIVKPGSDGIVCTGAPPSVSDCRITNAVGTGIDITADQAFVLANKVQGAGEDGLHVAGDDGEWTANKCTAAAGNGFLIDGVNNFVSFNKAHGSDGFDLQDNQPGNNTIEENKFGTTNP